MKLFDSHAHYNDEKFLEDRDIVLKEIREAGVEKLVIAGYNLASSEEGIKIAESYPNLYATVRNITK